MKLLRNSIYASLLIGLLATTASPQQADAAKLFKRYEQGGSYHRTSERVLTLTIEVPAAERKKIALRLCSKEFLLVALAIAPTNPFRWSELLVGAYSYPPQHVIFLRAEDCVGEEPETLEIWTLAENSSLPPHVEARLSSQVRSSTLGNIPFNRGVRDYRAATRELIGKLRANPTSRGVVIGYYFKRRSVALKRSLRNVKSLFERSGLPPDRYLIHTMYWNDEWSEAEGEPVYPRVLLVEEGEFTGVQ